VSALDPSAQALPIVGADVGCANPMSATGDIIVGGASGAATRLAIGSTGYVPRVVGGTVAWRELSSAGLLVDRPAAAAGREGQRYYATDAAAGLELSECVHKGGATYAWEVVSYGVTATGVALTQAASATAAAAAIEAPWSSTLAPSTVHTDDATVTTLESIPTTTDKGHAIDLLVTAVQGDRSAQVTWRITGSVTNAAGVCTVRNVVITSDDPGSAWAATVDVSGTSIRVRVTGAAATSLDWIAAGSLLVYGG
jgi:hypothetical protein